MEIWKKVLLELDFQGYFKKKLVNIFGGMF